MQVCVYVYVRRVDGDKQTNTSDRNRKAQNRLRPVESNSESKLIKNLSEVSEEVMVCDIMRAWETAPRHASFQLSFLAYAHSVLIRACSVFLLCACQARRLADVTGVTSFLVLLAQSYHSLL